MLAYPRPLHYLKPLPEEELTKLSQIDWLARVHQSDTIEGATAILDRDQATTMALSDDWADFRLEMRNEVTGFLASRHSQNYTEWNNTARALRGYFDTEVSPIIATRIAELGLQKELIASIGWDIVTALQEIAFSEFRIPRFHNRLFTIYQRGHFPCGISPLNLLDLSPDGTIQYH